jgi:CubicO group peptidase (beta-lactamase class C family)
MKPFLSLILILIASNLSYSQLSEEQIKQVDEIYVDWDKKDSPGAALGIIKDGKLIYSKGYGMANLEYDIPITNESVFRIGSTSKQFTAACIVLLSEQSKLNLDDKLSKYFPAFPKYANEITIQYLLNHTSGIRDYLTLEYLKGLRDSDYYEDEDILDLLANQSDVNFKPNSEFLYSNSGYWLLGQIVEKVSSLNMAEFAKKEIFEPLGMHNTHFHNDFQQIVKNRASGYKPVKDGFKIDMTTLNMIGDGGIFTSIEDMKLWDDAYYKSDILSESFWNSMTKRGILNNGEAITYASGLFVGDYKGLNSIYHGGAFVGFRANLVRFPDEKTTILQFANRSDGNPNRAFQVADVIFEDKISIPEITPNNSSKKTKTIKLSSKTIAEYEGHYWNEKSLYSRQIYFKNDTLWYERSNSRKSPLIAISKTSFKMLNVNSDIVVTFEVVDNNKMMSVTIIDDAPIESYSYVPVTRDVQYYETYLGEYYSEELDIIYELKLKEDKLHLFINGKDKSQLESIMKNLFDGDYGLLDFRSSESGDFLLQAGRVKNLKFVKK